MEELLIVDDLHLCCRRLMNTEQQLNNITKAGDMSFISNEMDTLLHTAKYLLKDKLNNTQLNSDMFSMWFLQEDTSIYQIMEQLENI